MNRIQSEICQILFVLVLALFAAGCDKKKEAADNGESQRREWKEMDEFHMVMAETFHPYKDSADLKPVKEKANELQAAAEKWATSPIPDRVNNDEMTTRLQQLRSEAEVLKDLVATADDAAIGQQLEKLHDQFHKIQEDWYGAGHGHEHHEH